MFKQQDLQRPWLNDSQAYQQHNDPLNPIKSNNNNTHAHTVYCQLCSQQKYKSQMFSISQHCDHLFCIQCLCKKLEQSMKKNQDLYCPIDFCPNLLSENTRFFTKLPNNLHNKYVIWKNSNQYMNRNQSLRASMRGSVKNSFTNKNIQKYDDMNYFGVRDDQNLPQPVQKEKKKKKKKQKKKYIPQKKEQQEQQEQQEQKMPIAPPPPPLARIAPPPPPPHIPIPPPARQIPAIPAIPPIPFAPQPQIPLLHNNINLPYVPYTCGRVIVKFLYIFFGIPLMFIIMALLILNMILIYSIPFASVLGFAVSVRYAIYWFIDAYNRIEKMDQYMSIFIGILCLFGCLICLIMLKQFINRIKMLNYLVITNSWIWFIKRLIKIWVYPSPVPVINLVRVLPEQRLEEVERLEGQRIQAYL